MPPGQPHPYAATQRARNHMDAKRASARRKASSSSPYPGAETRSSGRRVSFDKVLTRGPSPAYSGPSTSARRTGEGVDDGPSQQIWNEKSTTSPRPRSTVSQRSRRPVTESFEEYQPSSSFPYSQHQLFELAGRQLEAHKDAEACRRVHKLRAQIEDFAIQYTHVVTKNSRRPSVDLLCSDINNAKLVRYIGYLAQGGANGINGWRDLLTDSDCLRGLIVGIVGMALKEHVFSALWFGGTPAQIEELQQLEEEEKEEDGYKRTLTRSNRCWKFDDKDTSNYFHAALKFALALRKLLTPLLHMSDMPKAKRSAHTMPEELFDDLSEIVTDAGQLSREMRMCGNVIYHWSPTFKDEEFDPERMECLNIASMIRESPYELKKQPNGQNRSVLKGATEKAEAIVRITAFPGLVAHRQGGGLLAKELLRTEQLKDQTSKVNLPPDVRQLRQMTAEPPLTGNEGFRTRVICKSVVHLQWGQQRLLTKEAGTSRHLDAMRDGGMAKYENDRNGFVELFDYFLDKHPDLDRGSG